MPVLLILDEFDDLALRLASRRTAFLDSGSLQNASAWSRHKVTRVKPPQPKPGACSQLLTPLNPPPVEVATSRSMLALIRKAKRSRTPRSGRLLFGDYLTSTGRGKSHHESWS